MPDDERGPLTPAQVRTLRRLVHRAEVVLDEHRAQATRTPRTAGVSRQTAGAWLRRYRERGVEGLEDAARPGRPTGSRPTGTPPGRPDDADVLVAPLLADSPGWTSRSVATATGRTQSAVARVWRRTYEAGRIGAGDAVPPGDLTLVGCWAGATGSALILGSQPSSQPRSQPRSQPGSAPAAGAGFMRSPLRRPVQVLLATDLLATDLLATDLLANDLLATDLLATDLLATDPSHQDRSGQDLPDHLVQAAVGRHALCTTPALAARLREAGADAAVVDRRSWQGLLLELGPRLVGPETLADAQRQAMRWAATGRGPFDWVAGPGPTGPTDPTGTTGPTGRVRDRPGELRAVPVATSERLAEATLAALHQDVVAGRLRGGDRVTESYLARRAHASRGQVRDTLRVLAARGVVDLQPNRGAVVPIPGVEDVVETYAARSALGALIVRRVAESHGPGQLEELEAALRRMLATARTGDAWATGEDDLRFQEVLAAMAEPAGLRRVPGLFAVLTGQLRMMIALLGLRYAYSVEGMCADDAALLELIRRRNGAAAAGRWNRKMTDAAAYMIEQLGGRRTGQP